MKIEVGKKYVNERGTVIEIYAKNPYALIFHGANDTSHKVHDADRGMLYVSYFSGGTATPDCPGASNLVREYEEPVKYTVDLWVDRKPSCDGQSSVLSEYLFGTSLRWNKTQYKDCTRHLRITVEEVVE